MTTFEAQPWRPPPAPKLEGRYEENRRLAAAALWEVPGEGPEDVVVTSDGMVFTGLAGGEIVRFLPGGGDPATIAFTGGRPLGIEILGEGELVVCDADRGLLRVTVTGEITTLADSFDGIRLRFANNASIASDGTIYFTDSSMRYGLDEYVTDLLEHSGTGRLFARHPGGELECLKTGLQFANGVALDSTESSLFVAETGAYRINRLWLRGERAGEYGVFVENLPCFPDNLSFSDGVLWVAAPSPRQAILDALLPRPRLRSFVDRLPDRLKPKPLRHGMVLGFDEDGAVVYNLQDSGGRVAITTAARRHEDRLYIGTLTEPTLAVLDLG